MKRRQVFMKALVLAMSVSLTAGIPAVAYAGSGNMNYSDILQDMEDGDIMDWGTGSITIYKYDITSAEKDGVYTQGSSAATGQEDTALEETLTDYTIEGVEFSYLYCGKAETYSVQEDDTYHLELVYEVPGALAAILGLSEADAIDMTASANATSCVTGSLHFSSTQINDALETLLTEGDISAKNALEKYVRDSADTKAMDLTDENGMTSVDNLALGLYLIVETKVTEEVTDTVNPWFVSLPFTDVTGDEWLYDMTCYPKNQTGNPNLDKKVRNSPGEPSSEAGVGNAYDRIVSTEITENHTGDEYIANKPEYAYADTTTASTGDVLDYILISKLPHISSTATYLTEYTFTDTLSKGMTYNQDVHIAFYEKEADAAKNNTAAAEIVWNADSGYFNQNYAALSTGTDAISGKTQLTVSFTDEGLQLINGTMSDYYVVVYYTATLNGDATVVLGDDGNANDVTLEWRRTSDTYYNTIEDRSYVYTFGLDLTKEFSDNGGNAENVQFVLFNYTDAYYVTAEDGGVVDGKHVYFVTGKTLNKEEATAFSPSAQGGLLIKGLEADEYDMTEIQTDQGYSLLKEQIQFDLKTASCVITPSESGYVGNTDPENAHAHTDACMDASGSLICGMTALEDANGRTIGKTAMYVGDVTPATASVDGQEATLVSDDASENASIRMTVTNNKTFLLPQTGGTGLYAITIGGVLALAAGCATLFRRKFDKTA